MTQRLIFAWFWVYLEGQGEIVSGLITPVTHKVTLGITYLLSPPDPPSRVLPLVFVGAGVRMQLRTGFAHR